MSENFEKNKQTSRAKSISGQNGLDMLYPLRNFSAPFAFRYLRNSDKNANTEDEEKEDNIKNNHQGLHRKRNFNELNSADQFCVNGKPQNHQKSYNRVGVDSESGPLSILNKKRKLQPCASSGVQSTSATLSSTPKNSEHSAGNDVINVNVTTTNNTGASVSNISDIGNHSNDNSLHAHTDIRVPDERESSSTDETLPLSPVPSPRETDIVQFEQNQPLLEQQLNSEEDQGHASIEVKEHEEKETKFKQRKLVANYGNNYNNKNLQLNIPLNHTLNANDIRSTVNMLSNNLSKKEYCSLIFHMLQNLNRSDLMDFTNIIDKSLKSDFIETMPMELLTNIFQNLYYEDVKSCMLINKNWNDFINKTPFVWQNLMLKEGFIESSNFKKYCSSMENQGDYKEDFLINRKYYENWTNPDFIPNQIRMPGHVVSIITCLQFCDDIIITGADDRMIHVYDANEGKLIKKLSGHEGGVWALTYHKKSKLLISGGTDRTVRVWNIETGRCTHVFRGHTSTVRCLDVFEYDDKSFIVSGSRDSTLHVWKLPDPTSSTYDPTETINYPIPEFNEFFAGVLRGHTGSVRTLAGHGNIVVSGSYDHTLRVWDLSTMKCLYELIGHTHRIYSVLYDHKRKRCISSSMDFAIRVWDLGNISNNRLKDQDFQSEPLYSYPDGTIKIIGSMRVLQGHTGLVGLLSMSESMIMSAAADGTIRGWDCDDYSTKFSYNHKSICAVTTFFMNENILVSGSEIQFTIYNLRTKEIIHTNLLKDADQIWSVKFNNKKLVAAIEIDQKSAVVILDFSEHLSEEVIRKTHSYDSTPESGEMMELIAEFEVDYEGYAEQEVQDDTEGLDRIEAIELQEQHNHLDEQTTMPTLARTNTLQQRLFREQSNLARGIGSQPAITINPGERVVRYDITDPTGTEASQGADENTN